MECEKRTVVKIRGYIVTFINDYNYKYLTIQHCTQNTVSEKCPWRAPAVSGFQVFPMVTQDWKKAKIGKQRKW